MVGHDGIHSYVRVRKGFASSKILTFANITKLGKWRLAVGELAELLLVQIARHRNDFSHQRGGPRGRHPQVRSLRPLRSLIAGLVLAIAPLSVIGVAAPTAHADYAVENTISTAPSSRGITFASRQAATAAGREVCDELDQGMQASDVANNVMTQSGLDGYHAGFFIGASIAAFCPRRSQ